MEWAEELFTLKRSAKKGRRAAAAAAEDGASPREPNAEKPNSATSINALADSFEEDLDLNSVPKPMRSGGWADEPIKASGKNKAATSNLIEKERFQKTHLEVDNIPVIPDLEDLLDDAVLEDTSEPPKVAINRKATYNALNSDLLKQGAFASLDDIDLLILARYLLNERDLVEPDEVWTWDQLFTEVSGDIHAEKPKSADGGNAVG